MSNLFDIQLFNLMAPADLAHRQGLLKRFPIGNIHDDTDITPSVSTRRDRLASAREPPNFAGNWVDSPELRLGDRIGQTAAFRSQKRASVILMYKASQELFGDYDVGGQSPYASILF